MKLTVMRLCMGLATVGMLGACAAKDVAYSRSYPTSYEGALSDASAQAASSADWSTAQEIVVSYKDGEFDPMYVRLHKGKPYVLKVVNENDKTVSFRASEFFANASVASINATSYYKDELAQIEKPLLKSFIVAPNGERTVRFVPLTEGRYDFDNAYPGFFLWDLQYAPWGEGATKGTAGMFVVKQ